MPAILDRPAPLRVEPAPPTKPPLHPGARRLHGLAAALLARSGVDRHESVARLVWVRTDHDHLHRPLHRQPAEVDLRRTRLSRGDATLLSSHARDPEPAASDTTDESQTHPPTPRLRVSSPPAAATPPTP